MSISKQKSFVYRPNFQWRFWCYLLKYYHRPHLNRYIRAKYLWSNEWWFLLALSASSRQKLRGIFLQFVSAVGGAGAVGMLTEYSTLPHFKNLARYILPQHIVGFSKKDIPIFFYHKVNPFLVTAQSFDETMLQNIYCLVSSIFQWIKIWFLLLFWRDKLCVPQYKVNSRNTNSPFSLVLNSDSWGLPDVFSWELNFPKLLVVRGSRGR